MDPRFSEDEQTAKLKAWWQENRWSIIGGVGLGLAVVVGWNGWQSYTHKRADEASDLYERMIAEVEGNNLEAAQSAAAALKDDYASSVYAARAALYLARKSMENAAPAQAAGELRWAMEHASESASQHSARLRLACSTHCSTARARPTVRFACRRPAWSSGVARSAFCTATAS